MLKKNCDATSTLYKKLQKINNKRCGAKGKTQRDTINNKRLCWDDIRKEIVTKMDAQSNCVISSLVNDSKNKKKDELLSNYDLAQMKFPLRQSDTIATIGNGSLEEGPEFINKYFVGLFDPKNAAGFAEINLDKSGNKTDKGHKGDKGKPGKYADINSDNDVGFSSDPAFLYRLSTYNKDNKDKDNKDNKEKFDQPVQYQKQQL